MQMACECNPSSYIYGDSRFDPYAFTACQLDELIHRLELSKIMEETCSAVIVIGNRAYFPANLFLQDDPAGRRAIFTSEHRNGRSLIVE
jgi:hypothetical protein